jgi:arabinofuranan 3-O-arabinosyltransferase
VTGTSAPRLSDPRPSAGESAGPGSSWRERGRRAAGRYRWLACCVFLLALPFATAPGHIIADTKFELVVNPTRFLSSALSLWDPQQFGGLLNQAVGYLFPMGPFFELGRLLSVEGWILQRLWIGVLLVVAFAGVERLARRLDIGTPWPRAAGGLAYALSPAALSIIGSMSGEFLPMAMLPWILIPLTDARPWRRGTGAGYPGPSARARAVARSAAAVALCSGMNAASAVAVLVPALLYIVARPGAWPRTRMLAWWIPAVVLVTALWSVPLVLLSKYGVSVVPYTESAQVTSSSTSLLNIFRGTENWVSFLVVNGLYWRPIAFQVATEVLPTLLTGLLAALGLAGLLRHPNQGHPNQGHPNQGHPNQGRTSQGRAIPERRFLLWSALIGLLVISLGYVSNLGSPLENTLIGLINGPGAPFRNLWKFDPMLRLPLALGVAHILSQVQPVRLRTALAAAASAALAGLVLPAVTTGLASDGSFGQVPSYWVDAASWLNTHAGKQAVLVEPGAPFGQYLWGSPMDDVLQALTDTDYAERNLATVGSAGNERLLNAIDQQLAAGDGSAGLTQVLARMGVKYVLVRNDLSRPVLNGTWPARISDALAASPGITPVAQFGPLVSGLAPDDAATDFDAPYPAVQIFQVAGAQPAAVVQSAASTLRVYGAPESLITLAGQGLLGSRPVLVNDDGADQPVAGSVVTGSLRRRAVNFGQLRTNFSPTLTATEPADTFLATDDYSEPGWTKYQAVAQYTGIEDVTASSSDSDLKAFSTQWASGALPFSAVDADLRTMWESGSWNGPVGQWIQTDFDAPVNPHVIKVAFAVSTAIGPPVTQVTVSTAAGQVSDQVQVTGNLQRLRVPAGPSSWLRITVTGLAYQPPAPVFGPQVGIASIVVPGVTAHRTIVAPSVARTDPSAVVLSKAQPQPSSCMLTSLRWVCSPLLSFPTEEQYGFDQSFTEPSAGQAAVRGSAVLADSSLADRYARFGQQEATATASSVYISAPQDQPRSAFDGDPATTWIASSADRSPTLTIRWRYQQTVRKVTIARPPGASGPAQLLITGSGGQARGGTLGAGGVVRFAPMKTTSLRISFTQVQAPLEVSDVTIPGVPYITAPPDSVPFRLPCGLGPQLKINGITVPTKASGTFTDLLNGRPLKFTACSQAILTAGTNRVTEPEADGFSVQAVVLGTVPRISPPRNASAPRAADIVSWTSSVRQLRVDTAARSYLVVNENFNPGWRAAVHGRALRAVRLDGWKQAWMLPAGTTGVVTLTYRPESLYRDAVAGGLAALAVVLLVAVVRFRRRRPPPVPGISQWPQPPARPRRPRWVRWFGLAAGALILAGAGLVLGGYPGAALVPAAALAFALAARTRRQEAGPWLLAGLLVVASACGAVGEHLALSGDIGLEVSAPANAIPQIICLIVVGGMAAALLRPALATRKENENALPLCTAMAVAGPVNVG